MRSGLEKTLLFLTFVCLVVFGIHSITAHDIWWQLKAGEWILTHGLPGVDPFSFAFPEREWIEPRWLFCVLVSGVFRYLGLNALIVLKLLFLVLTFALLARLGTRTSRWATLAGLLTAIAGAHDRFMIRPELISFVFLVATLLALQRFRQTGKTAWLAGLPIVQLVWCNAHTLWILGPVAQWILLAGEIVDRRRPLPVAQRLPLLVCAGACSLIALANPYFWRGALFPFRLFLEIRGGHVLNESIAEFHSPLSAVFFGWNYRSVVLLVVIVLGAGSFVLNRRRLSLGRLALWVAFFVLALMAQRNVALLGLVSGWAVLLNATEYDSASGNRRMLRVLRVSVPVVSAVYLLAMIPLTVTDVFYRDQGRVERFGFGVTDRRFPIRAMEFVRTENLPRPVLSSLGDGGFVLFEGGPRSVYVDPRLEVYGGAILADALELTWSGAGFSEEIQRTGVQTVLVRNRFQHRKLLLALEQSTEWVAVYFDHLHVIYLQRNPRTRDLTARLAVDWSAPGEIPGDRPSGLAPVDWLGSLGPRAGDGFVQERLGTLFLGMGNYERAHELFREAVDREPKDHRSRLFLALFERALGNIDRAQELAEGVPRKLRDRADVEFLAGEIQMWAGRPADAVESFRRALVGGGHEPIYARSLVRAAYASGNFQLAESTLRAMIARGQGGHETWNSLGDLLLRNRRLDEAIECFVSSLRIHPDQIAVARLLKTIYRDLGQDERAAEMARIVSALEGKNPSRTDPHRP